MISAEPGGGLPRRARIALPIVIVLLVLLSWHRYSQSPARPFVAFSGPTMGTTFSVKLALASLPIDEERAVGAAIAARLERVNALMSTWQDDSELSRFNRQPPGEPFAVAPETLRVFELSRRVHAESDGAFDPTVAPLVRAWGFGADAAPSPPSEAELEALQARVGFDAIAIDSAAGTLTRKGAGVVCDLSAVAKGFAVDEVARALGERGYTDFLVEIGGELRASGRHRDGSPWRVAIEAPATDPLQATAARSIHRIVLLGDRAMATSGDYRNVYELAGERVAHIIDPRSGRPAAHGLASVTVIHAEAAVADAWATALQVLGP
ncbi:MAG: FAD:protein FMN transferase, partial [Myxococcales bacterium]|nr:FAD:protein FMN transferase [Myxococcales bacterium]